MLPQLLLLALASASADSRRLPFPIDEAALPSDPAVRKAWSAALAQEPFAAGWEPEWRHAVDRAEVARILAGSLGTLRKAATASEGLELQLAVGLTARYAYNVDVEGALQAGEEALARAARGHPADPRPTWLLGTNLCQTLTDTARGMTLLLRAQEKAADRPLPGAYWRERARCASMTLMPASALHAVQELERSGDILPEDLPLAARVRELLREPDPAVQLPVEEAWSVGEEAAVRMYRSRTCGFALRAPATQEWKLGTGKGGCIANGSLGPFTGKTGEVFPSILVLARVAGKDETLEGFAGRFAFMKGASPAGEVACPAGSCRALASGDPQSYAPEGGGLALAVLFERAQPDFPGRLLEEPISPQSAGKGAEPGKVTYLRPTPRYVRFPGRIHYLVLLDSARSVEQEARAEFLRFLRELRVE